MEDNVKFGTECPGNDCLRTDGFICGPDSCGIADGRAEFLCADLARPTLTQALALPEVKALVEAAKVIADRNKFANPMRSADMHKGNCQCARCHYDALDAALAAVRGNG